MYKTGIRLNHPNGTFCCFITESRLRTEIRKGNVKRASTWTRKNQTYQIVPPPPASQSKNTKPEITIADMRKVVGEQRLTKDKEEIDLERLIGFGLIAPNTAPPLSGYLR